jgi:DNA-binding winged helix-turn-helix (wHTH) protein
VPEALREVLWESSIPGEEIVTAAMNKESQHLFEFGPFQLDPGNHLLLRDGKTISLPPKAFETLLPLVERRGKLLEREELLKTVWPDTFVEENNLTHYISMLRKALGDGGEGSTYIETVPKLGYRFVGEVREIGAGNGELLFAKHVRTHIVVSEQEEQVSDFGVGTAPTTQAIVPRRQSPAENRWRTLIGLAGTAVLIAASLITYNRRPVRLTVRDSILLADFENSTGEDVFDVAPKRALTVKLEESPFLSIVPESRVRETLRFMGRSQEEFLTPALAREVCQRRSARAFISGSVARLGSQYVLAFEADQCATGDPIARVQVDAASKEKILPAMGEAMSSLRRKLGESLNSLQKFDTPIQEATTPSLEALKPSAWGNNCAPKESRLKPFLSWNTPWSSIPILQWPITAWRLSTPELENPIAPASIRKRHSTCGSTARKESA